MGLFTFDGESYTTIGSPWPRDFNVWNIDQRARVDWLGGSASTRSLRGIDRANPGGYRADIRISLRNSTPDTAQNIRDLLNGIFDNENEPKIIGVKIVETADFVYCNLRSSAYGIRRDLTIGRQAINLQLIGVERKAEIPDLYQIG